MFVYWIDPCSELSIYQWNTVVLLSYIKGQRELIKAKHFLQWPCLITEWPQGHVFWFYSAQPKAGFTSFCIIIRIIRIIILLARNSSLGREMQRIMGSGTYNKQATVRNSESVYGQPYLTSFHENHRPIKAFVMEEAKVKEIIQQNHQELLAQMTTLITASISGLKRSNEENAAVQIIFWGGFICNCFICYFTTAKISFTSILYTQFTRMIFIIFLTCNQSLENQITKTTMLVELTIEVYEESFVIVHQHGGNDVNCNPRIHFTCMFLHSLSLIYSMWCKKSVRKSYFHSETKSITDSITLRLDKFNNNIPWLARTIYNYANCSVAMFTRARHVYVR